VCVDGSKPIIISAAKAYDPDYPDDALTYTWYCSAGQSCLQFVE